MSVQNVFQNIPTTVGLDGATPHLIDAQTTAPNITTTITTINTTSGNHTGTISETNVVQIKVIISYRLLVQILLHSPVTTGVGISTIVFNAVGDTVTLIWTNSKWHIVALVHIVQPFHNNIEG